MSLYFLVNNLHFAFGMIGAIVLVMASWLTFDSFRLKHDTPMFLRFSGLTLFSIWQIIHSLDVTNDAVLYIGYGFLIIGLALIVISFLKTKQLAVNAIVIIPAFSLWYQQLSIVSTILFLAIAYLAFKQGKKEYNKTWTPFAVAFSLFGITYLLNIFLQIGDKISFIYIASNLIEIAGFVSLGIWVWQYMRLRIQESMMMILIGSTFILSTIVTLAFSTILIGRVITETSNSLLTDVKVLDYSISGLEEEALAKAELISVQNDIINSLDKNDVPTLDQVGGQLLEKYKLGFLIIADKDGNVVVRANALSKRGDTLVGERALEEALLNNPMVTIEDSSAEGFSIRAGSPIINNKGKIIGAIIAGFPLDNALTDNMKRLTGLEMFIYKGDTSIAGTALGVDGRTRLVGEKINNSDIKNSVLVNGKTIIGSVNIFGTVFQASYLPLLNSDEKVVGMITVAKAQQDIVNIANATNRLTLSTVIIILLVLLFPIYYISKKFGSDIK